MFEVDVWLNSHSVDLPLGSNPSFAMFLFAVILFGKLFLPQDSTFLAHILELGHSYLCQHDRAMQEWVHYISFEAGISL